MATVSDTLTIEARPYAYSFPRAHTALLVIDMQRDFLLEDGFGEIQGGNLSAVQASIEPTRKLLEACRTAGLAIFHTREGHLPDMSDCPSSKVIRQAAAPENTQHTLVIGDRGKMGRLLVRGEYGHDIVDELKPVPGEVVIDKAGKGAFWNTVLMHKLKAHGITHLILAGVTTECCVTTTFREANDRGFECCAITEATAGYNDAVFKGVSLDMLHWSKGLFGFVATLQPLLDVLQPLSPYLSLNDPTSPPQTPPEWDGDLRISSLQQAYRTGLSPVKVIESLYSKIATYETVNPGAWIHLVPKATALAAAQDLMTRYPSRAALPPLFGIPFTVKDSIDVASLPTTTACAPLSHIPSASAPVYSLVSDAGALFLGKVNLDQLATGLSGCRSPYGTSSSVFHRSFVSGGSSSGSAVTVGARLASFSLATDTAGSGRVPAMFNGVVGFKPTRGTVPFVGITPACLSLDCVAVIAQNISDARAVWQTIETFDPRDPYAKPPLAKLLRPVHSLGAPSRTFRFGIPPPEALSVLSPPYHRLFLDAVVRLQSLGGQLRQIDYSPFAAAGNLLYDGSFVVERLASLPSPPGEWLAKTRPLLHPVISDIFTAVLARAATPADVYRDLQAQARLTALVRNAVFAAGEGGVDVVVVPTAPTHFTIEEMEADPIKRNSFLGTFTHSGNVLDLCAVACPAGTYEAGELVEGEEGRLPFGVTFLGVGGSDADVLEVARRFEGSLEG
ncbi:amidase signature enzyme [Coniochaeta ligniaria NRRL 30616]|uniref:Amidase signature enzyme n=1 Tax=Coniochaeta ligniaria NRRL 30616 TaxID=1408157 RepID=A0A1J7JUD4_9PEZI|nr:amidase signature enzyme [Coniochaeta ligniaria NRRL 30616]